MNLLAGCPRCSAPIAVGHEGDYACRVHGRVTPLWRAAGGGYDEFVEHLRYSAGLPTWLPWPLPGGWAVSDFGTVIGTSGPQACFATCAGSNDRDGVVEVSILTEEPGTGLGARCAGLAHIDPGSQVGSSPPHAKLEVEGMNTALWAISTSDADTSFDRMVFVGEAQGRWLWVVLRPASAALLLAELGSLTDVSRLGPTLVDLPFNDTPPAW